jgi:hypothetical protein
MFRTGAPSPSERAAAASNSEIPNQSLPEACSSHFQSDPTNDKEPGSRTSERESAAIAAMDVQNAEFRPAGTMAPPRPVLSPQLRATQDRELYSSLNTRKDPDTASGANLSFDFADEEPTPDQASFAGRKRRKSQSIEPSDEDSEEWKVGFDELTPSEARSADNEFGEEEPSRPPRRPSRTNAEPQFTNKREFLDEDGAPVYNRAMTHSARFFLLLVFLVGAGFAALTLLIHGDPGACSVALSYLPIVGDRFVIAATPAKLVALRDVDAVYQQSKEGQKTLVISGTAENVGTASLRIVQLTTVLRDVQRHLLLSQAVYCGNSVSPGMISQMTPHEIEFFQKLEPAGTFALEPLGSCHFVAVFMNPPGTARAYDVSVSQAVLGIAPNAEEPAS